MVIIASLSFLIGALLALRWNVLVLVPVTGAILPIVALIGIARGEGEMHVVAHPDAVEQVLIRKRDTYPKGGGYDAARALLGDGLLTSEGAAWQARRRLLQPHFHPRAVAPCAAEVVAPSLGVTVTAVDVHDGARK